MEYPYTSFPDHLLLAQALEACVIGVVITDARQADHPVVYVNAAFERLTGYAATEVVGRNCRFLQGENHNQVGRHEIRVALEQGHSITTVLRDSRKDGTMFYN
jgi:PAS domain S-box-containing protein